MRFRKATRKDVKKVVDIFIEGGIDEDKMQYPEKSIEEIRRSFEKNRKNIEKKMKEEISEKRRLFVVIEINKKIIGIGQAYVEGKEWDRYGGLGKIYIIKEYRKKGIGTKVVSYLISYLKKKKIDIIESYIYTNNTPSKKLHEKFSFKPESVKYVRKLK